MGKRTGDVLEVKLVDASFNPYFKQKVRINDPKAVKELVRTLQEKGIDIKPHVPEEEKEGSDKHKKKEEDWW